MIPYKMSRDYTKLKQLLDEGNEIVIFYNTNPNNEEHIRCSLSSRIKMRDNNYAYDIGPLILCYWHFKKNPFEFWCEKFDVRFIEPNL